MTTMVRRAAVARRMSLTASASQDAVEVNVFLDLLEYVVGVIVFLEDSGALRISSRI